MNGFLFRFNISQTNNLGMGEIGVGPKGRNFASSFQGINGKNTPAGPSQTPLGRGFDLSIIGDIILHKGKTFLTLGTLVSALELDGSSKVMLNQKITTQDNKASDIFVGENIPFTGSVVNTVGASQQTTANIEYRDVGVARNIKPRLGNEDIITLEISEEISQPANHQLHRRLQTRNSAKPSHLQRNVF